MAVMTTTTKKTHFNVSCFVFQGTNASALEKDIGPEQFPINEHYFGLVNVSITKSSYNLTKVIAKNTGVTFQNKLLWDSGESCPLLDRQH